MVFLQLKKKQREKIINMLRELIRKLFHCRFSYRCSHYYPKNRTCRDRTAENNYCGFYTYLSEKKRIGRIRTRNNENIES